LSGGWGCWQRHKHELSFNGHSCDKPASHMGNAAPALATGPIAEGMLTRPGTRTPPQPASDTFRNFKSNK